MFILELGLDFLRFGTPEGVGERAKTIEYRFGEVSNENKERAELSVPKREQATIFSEDHEVQIPSPQ